MTKVAPRREFVVTRAELARLIGCAPDRVTKYVAAGMPGTVRAGGGRGHPTEIDLAAALPWLLTRRAGTLDEERTRYFKLTADRIQQDIRRRAGELVDAADVDHRWASLATAVRERLLALPSTALQRRLIAADAEEALIALVDDALTDLSTRGNHGGA